MLNNIMDQEARAEQARRQMQYFGHCKYEFLHLTTALGLYLH